MDQWLASPNVCGVLVGRKTVHGIVTDDQAVGILVRHKLALARLASAERIPSSIEDRAGRRMPTDVIDTHGGIVAHAGGVRPVHPGLPIGNVNGLPGTLGLIVRKIGGMTPLGLSCSHVLGCSGVLGVAGQAIEQPWSLAPSLDDRCGQLAPGFSVLSSTAVNHMDAALAEFSVEVSAAMGCTGVAPSIASTLTAAEYVPGTLTVLDGALTKGAQGSVIGAGNVLVQQIPFVGDAIFADLVVYSTLCAEGDSGAAVLSDDHTTVYGLHVGGSAAFGAGIGVFEPIGPILVDLSIELWT